MSEIVANEALVRLRERLTDLAHWNESENPSRAALGSVASVSLNEVNILGDRIAGLERELAITKGNLEAMCLIHEKAAQPPGAATPYQAEQIEVLRRIGERAKLHCLQMPADKHCGSCIDLWQHMLDELQRLKLSAPASPAQPSADAVKHVRYCEVDGCYEIRQIGGWLCPKHADQVRMQSETKETGL